MKMSGLHMTYRPNHQAALEELNVIYAQITVVSGRGNEVTVAYEVITAG
jgi:hypothetical protein